MRFLKMILGFLVSKRNNHRILLLDELDLKKKRLKISEYFGGKPRERVSIENTKLAMET
jgi:hypothetical protein